MAESPSSPPTHTSETRTEADKRTSVAGILVRLTWMFLGNAVLFFSGVFVLQQRGRFGIPDIVYGACVPTLLAVRYADIRFYDGKTADYEPATMAHWRGYAWRLVLVALVLWGVAHGVGYAGLLGK